MLSAIAACAKPHIQQELPLSGENRSADSRPKVIMLLVDSLQSAAIDRLMQANKLPKNRLFDQERGVQAGCNQLIPDDVRHHRQFHVDRNVSG